MALPISEMEVPLRPSSKSQMTPPQNWGAIDASPKRCGCNSKRNALYSPRADLAHNVAAGSTRQLEFSSSASGHFSRPFYAI
jgi:hypothetical protein